MAQGTSPLEPTPTPTEVPPTPTATPVPCPFDKVTVKAVAAWDSGSESWIWAGSTGAGLRIDCVECGDVPLLAGDLFCLDVASNGDQECRTSAQVTIPPHVDAQFLSGGSLNAAAAAPVCRDGIVVDQKTISFGLEGDDTCLLRLDLCIEVCPCTFHTLKMINEEGWIHPEIGEFSCGADCCGHLEHACLLVEKLEGTDLEPTKIKVSIDASECEAEADSCDFTGGCGVTSAGGVAGVVVDGGAAVEIGDGSEIITAFEVCVKCCGELVIPTGSAASAGLGAWG